MAVTAPATGTLRYGGMAYGGAATTGPGGGGGAPTFVYALEANDRHQVLALVGDGTASAVPVWAYINPEPAPWAEALMSPNPSDYPTFFALDGAGAYPDAIIESPVFDAEADQEFQISGVWVDFYVRPNVMDNYDGGIGTLDPTFTVETRGWGIPSVTNTGGGGFATQVVTSDPKTFTVADGLDVADDPWPHHRSAYLACRLEQSVRAYQVIVTAAFGVEFVAFRPVGVRRSRRAGG